MMVGSTSFLLCRRRTTSAGSPVFMRSRLSPCRMMMRASWRCPSVVMGSISIAVSLRVRAGNVHGRSLGLKFAGLELGLDGSQRLQDLLSAGPFFLRADPLAVPRPPEVD